MICRLVQGLSQACIVPGIHSFFGKWAPLEERARLVGFAQGGIHIVILFVDYYSFHCYQQSLV